MEILCPKCMGTLAISGDDRATCTLQGERYKILFLRSNDQIAKVGFGNTPQNVAADNTHSDDSSQLTMCVQHPEVRGKYFCDHCAASICDVCNFPQPNGTHLCPNCVQKKDAVRAVCDIEQIKVEVSENGHIIKRTPLIPVGQICSRHPGVQAVRLCKICGAGICSTCDFSYPGDVHLCPTCATKPKFKLQGKRRTYLTWSYVLAVFATLAIICFFIWSATQSIDSTIEEEVLGQLAGLFIILPSLVGAALGCAAIDRRLFTPASVWVATIWNGLILGLFILLCIVGLFM